MAFELLFTSMFKFSVFFPALENGNLAFVSDVEEVEDSMDKYEVVAVDGPPKGCEGNDVFWSQGVQKADFCTQSLREEFQQSNCSVERMVAHKLMAARGCSRERLDIPFLITFWTFDFFRKDIVALENLREALAKELVGCDFDPGERALLQAIVPPINDFFRGGAGAFRPIDYRTAPLGSIEILRRPNNESPATSEDSRREEGYTEMFSMSPDEVTAPLQIPSGPESSRSQLQDNSSSTTPPTRSSASSSFSPLTRVKPIHNAESIRPTRGHNTTPSTRPSKSSSAPASLETRGSYNAKPIHPKRGYSDTPTPTPAKRGPKKRPDHPSHYTTNWRVRQESPTRTAESKICPDCRLCFTYPFKYQEHVPFCGTGTYESRPTVYGYEQKQPVRRPTARRARGEDVGGGVSGLPLPARG